MSDVLDSAADSARTPAPTSKTADDEVANSNHIPENNGTSEGNVGQPPAVTVAITETEPSSSSASSSRPRVAKVYATTAEAIANFRPSSREVVRGIAPHVFDERKRRRSHPRSRSRSPKPYWYAEAANGENSKPSPLRGATVISWDEHSIYIEQPDVPPKRAPSAERPETALVATSENSLPENSENHKQGPPQRTTISNRRIKVDTSGWKPFRVDVRLLKSIGIKLRLATSLSPSTKARP